jgi:transcriptional regulator with XRE-family HTH domain
MNVSKIDKNLSENLKMRMALRELSIQQVADLAELSYQAVYHVLNADRWPSPANLERIARAVHASPAELLAEPVAIDRPDVPTAWRVLKDFMDRLSPLKVELVEALAALDDSQVRRYLRMITAETSAASSADDVRPSTQALREPGKRAK